MKSKPKDELVKLCEESDLIKRVRKILQSGDVQIIDCLLKNLLAYEHILNQKKETDQLAENLKDLQRQIAEMKLDQARESSDYRVKSTNTHLSVVPGGLS